MKSLLPSQNPLRIHSLNKLKNLNHLSTKNMLCQQLLLAFRRCIQSGKCMGPIFLLKMKMVYISLINMPPKSGLNTNISKKKLAVWKMSFKT